MASPRPRIVTTLTANTETSVNALAARSAANEPRIEVMPMASGRLAAVRLPKTTTSSTASTGSEIISARAMSSPTRSLMSRSTVVAPPIAVSSPGADSSASTASRASVRSSVSPASCSTA
jgi:hypothetical protein